ncbi:MAG: TonB-dependent receptor [Gemmatimonadetes bacterium]|nr:TonB-dependent receptor [Gemmatimonadota bacterium]
MYLKTVRISVAVCVAMVAMALTVGAASAQSGTITGGVSAQTTGQSLSNVQVFIRDLNIGSLTQANGRYLLILVPVGTHTLGVSSIGYGTQTVQVTVRSDQVTELNFELASVALDLDEIVVTGTGAPTQRRRLGQTIATVSAEAIAVAPVTDVAGALVGRLPGARGLISGGQTGAGSAIILRGTASVSQRQSPLIYVDGIRIDNRRETAESVSTDRLMDINPQDIDHIEVIKGAAAATLFGTEASSGVIQIFTKRGITGAPRYSFSTDLQKLEFPRRFEENCSYFAADNNIECNYPYDTYGVSGYHQNYTLSVQGGTPSIGYFVSGRIMEEVNPSPNNELANKSVRASFDFKNSSRISSTVDFSYVDRQLTTATPGWGDVFGNLMLGNPARATEENPDGAYSPIKGSLVQENFQNSQNFLASASLGVEWAANLKSTVRVGYNFIDSRFSRFFPQGVVSTSVTGSKSVSDRRSSTTTLDFNTYWEKSLTDRLMTNVTVGAQSFREVLANDRSAVRTFGSPTLSTLSGGQEITGVSEGYEEVINAGFYGQAQIGLDDKLFVTGGLRLDGNSAFGSEFGLQAYPKAGLSLVVSDYDFWNVPGVNEFRLRGALGTSGLQPGAFDAQRTWNPNLSSLGGYITPNNLGNDELKPERSTEIEVGLEAGMFDGRFSLEAVYFNQTTDDALLPITPSSGTGFQNSQLRNIGQLKSWGVEIITQTALIQRSNIGLDLTVSPSFLKQWVSDMGDVADFRLGSRRRFQSLYEGLWPGIVIAPICDPAQCYTTSVPVAQITNINQIASNTLKNAAGGDSLVVVGRPQPNQTLDMGLTLRVGNLTFQNIFEGARGFIESNETKHLRVALKSNRLMADVQKAVADPTTDPALKAALIDEYGRAHNGIVSNTMYSGDYLRWAEATVAYRVPESFVSNLGATGMTVSLGVKNVHVFSSYLSENGGWIDPGTRGIETDDAFLQNIDYLKTPSPRRFVLSIRTQF